MLTRLLTPVRTLLLVAVFALSMPFATAQPNAEPQRSAATAQTYSERGRSSNDDPTGGLLIILGIVGGLILLAWIASRIGDTRTDTVE
jgi:hypothetical protein